MLIDINYDRIRVISSIIRKLGLKFFKDVEILDPQFNALSKLCNYCSSVAILASMNALVSYELNCRGEKYWNEFSSFMNSYCITMDNSIGSMINTIVKFIQVSQCNKRYRSVKIERIKKLLSCKDFSDIVMKEPSEVIMKLNKVLAKCLNTSQVSKTIVFAVKMYYYGHRACSNIDLTLPMNLPIPVDRRVALVTYTANLINVDHKDSKIFMKYSNTIRRVWSYIANLSNVPPLHIDSFIWIIGKYIDLKKPKSKVISLILNELSNIYCKDLERLVRELLFRFN